jgi:hypothetical protein
MMGRPTLQTTEIAEFYQTGLTSPSEPQETVAQQQSINAAAGHMSPARV